MRLGHFLYRLEAVPVGYRCTTCGAQGCKLWREYAVFFRQVDLLCCDCAGKREGKDVSRIDTYGMIARTDQIGWLVPAVPTEEGDSFWGYTSAPLAGVDWWKRLPTRHAKSSGGGA